MYVAGVHGVIRTCQYVAKPAFVMGGCGVWWQTVLAAQNAAASGPGHQTSRVYAACRRFRRKFAGALSELWGIICPMGSIEERGSRFRARIRGRGESATFGTRAEAESWLLTQQGLHAIEQARADPKTAVERFLAAVPERVMTAAAALPVAPEALIFRSMPNPEQSGVYFLIDGGVIKYVGQSLNVLRRIQRHVREGRTFERFCFIPCPPEALDATEERYILALMPKWNRVWLQKAALSSP